LNKVIIFFSLKIEVHSPTISLRTAVPENKTKDINIQLN